METIRAKEIHTVFRSKITNDKRDIYMQRVKGLKQLSGKKSVKKKQPKGFPVEYQTIKISNAFQKIEIFHSFSSFMCYILLASFFVISDQMRVLNMRLISIDLAWFTYGGKIPKRSNELLYFPKKSKKVTR